MQYFKILCMSPLLPTLCITICTTVRKIFHFLLVVFFISSNIFSLSRIRTMDLVTNPYSSLAQLDSILTLTLGSRNVNTTLQNVVSTLCNVISTLYHFRVIALYQRCAALKIRRCIFFHFERLINVVSTLIHNVKTTLMRQWNFGWEEMEI